jgi:hypothetical protein
MLKAILYTFLVLFIGGCSAYKINAVHIDKNFAFEKARTFAWIPDHDTAANRFDNKKMRDEIRHFITSEIEKKGLTLDTENPDLLADIVLQNIPLFGIVAESSNAIGSPVNPQYNKNYNHFYNSANRNPNINSMPPLRPNVFAYITQPTNYVDNSININLVNPHQGKVIWTCSSEADRIDLHAIGSSLHLALLKMLKQCPIWKIKNVTP